LTLALLSVAFLSLLHVSAQEDDHDDDVDISDPELDPKSTPTTSATDADQDEIDEDGDEIEQQMYILPAPDVKTNVIFPDFPDKRFVQGEEVTILLDFHNTGSSEYNITYIGGHLHSLIDYGYIIQNFSVREIGAIVGPGEQVTVEYHMRPDPSLEPIEFLFSSWIFYNNSDDQIFRNVYVNSTVELLEKRSELDAKTLFQYLLFAAVVGLIGYTFVQVSASGKKFSRAVGRSAKSKNAGPAKWDTPIYTQATKAKAVLGSRGGRKSSNKKRSINRIAFNCKERTISIESRWDIDPAIY